jgi:tRNA-modifying protein YgfZ
MPTVHLANRAVIEVAGPDAEHFLQNIVTTDLDKLGKDEAKPGALLSPQGKILFDFLISRAVENTLRLDVRADVADDFVRRLMLYRLRAKAEISKQEHVRVAASWQNDSDASETDSSSSHSGSTASQVDSGWLRDTRFPAAFGVRRRYGSAPAADAAIAEWDTLRVRHGIAESGVDYALGEAFPHDVLLDQTGGIGFRKGCYVGQEVVSRMQHRGTARRRVLLAEAAIDLPSPGTEITAGGRTIGQLGTVSGRNGLATARIDRVKDAMDAGVPLLAGNVEVTLSIPPWAGFSFPETAAGAEEA